MPRGQMMAHGAIYQAEATPWQKKKKKKGLSLGSTPPPPKSWGTTIFGSWGFGFDEEENMQDEE